jgi:hypothetical protein
VCIYLNGKLPDGWLGYFLQEFKAALEDTVEFALGRTGVFMLTGLTGQYGSFELSPKLLVLKIGLVDRSGKEFVDHADRLLAQKLNQEKGSARVRGTF